MADTARAAAWTVGLYGGVTLLGALLVSHRGASLAIQTFAAEWGAGKVGVAWSDPMAPAPTAAQIARRVAAGAALGGGAAALLLVLAVATHAATVSGGSGSGASFELGMGLLVAVLTSVRDELILRGMVLRAFRHTLSAPLQVLVCGAVGVGAYLGEHADAPLATAFAPAALPSLAIAFFTGAAFGLAWLEDRGGWVACGAHAAWTFLTGTVIAGGLCSVSWSVGVWGGGRFDASLVTATGLAALTTAAFVWYRRRVGRFA